MLTISLMRWIDQSVGTVACHLFAAAKVASKPFTRKVETYKKIAVMKFFGIGSIVVASPSLIALREAFPDAEIWFVTFKGNKEILDILGLVDRAILIDPSSAQAFVKTTLAAARTLRREKVDLAVDYEFFAKFPLALASLAQVPKKVGFYLSLETWRQALLDVHGFYNHYYHTKDIFLSLVYLLATGDKYYLDFEKWQKRYTYPTHHPTDEELARVRGILAEHGYREGQRIVLVNSNAAVELAAVTKRWPEERYAELADRITAEYPDAFVALIGAPSEKVDVAGIVRMADNPRVVSLAGTMSLRELLALLSIADLFVTNDSGPMHLACLVKVPIIGLFFAETPTLFGPIAEDAVSVTPTLYSLPLFTVYTGKASTNMENIPARLVSVERVLGHVHDALGRSEGPRAAAAGLH